jgi:hypothetical protein
MVGRDVFTDESFRHVRRASYDPEVNRNPALGEREVNEGCRKNEQWSERLKSGR